MVNVGPTDITLSWSPPPEEAHNGEITHYVIMVLEVQTGHSFSSSSNTEEITLGNLHPYYDYSITVAAHTIEIGPSSSAINVRTSEAGKLPVHY